MGNTTVISNIFILFALMGVGYLLGWRRVLPETAAKELATILMEVSLPAMILSSMQSGANPELLKSGLWLIALCLLMIGLSLALSWQAARLLRVPPGKRGVWSFAAALPNNGFMGFPVVYAAYGDEGLFLAVLLNLVFSLVFYSLGVKLLCRDSAHPGQVRWRKILTSSPNLALALGLTLLLLELALPAPVLAIVNYLGDMTVPLSMLLIGLSLSHGKPSALFRDRHAFSAALVRLVVLPLLCLGITLILPVPIGDLAPKVLVLICAMPTAAICLIFAQQYDCDAELAGKAIFLSCLLSVITIPLILLLL